ncbi:uncharacterized protein LOC114872928 [Osmia bicornis bicornis]|uniref:uncharacterized protein LOC114872928 n=1 Tax=Osmia bicornis bicornis TaxID=1437191 RepID=UPI001EAEEA9F|nr:uncharacterized protein LOC114872928 [Osmia bicornis bicornis]
MIHSSFNLLFICIMIPLTRNILLYPKLYSFIETNYSNHLSNQDTNNLKLILNFIRNDPEFHPLTFAVVQPEFQSNLVDFLLRYIGDKSIEAYTARDRDLSIKATWMKRVKATWVISVRDLYSLHNYIYWQPKLWRSSNQYLIIYLGKQVTLPWRDIFKTLWKQYSVYKAVIISVEDDFQCLMKYMPFDDFQNDFGAVYKLCPKDLQGYSMGLKGIDEIHPPEKPRRLFENFQNLQNYPVNVITFESPLMSISYDNQNRTKLRKLDASVLYTLEKALKANFRIKAMRKRDFRPEDPFTVSLRNIENGNVEMVIASFFIKEYSKFRKFQFTCAVYEDKMCFMAPDSGLVPKAYMPLLPFRKEVWLILFVYNIVITLLWCFLRYINQQLRQRATEHHIRGNQARNNSHELIDPSSVTGFKPESSKTSKKSQNLNFHSLMESEYQGPSEIPRWLSFIFIFLEMLFYPLKNGSSLTQNCLLSSTLFFSLIVSGLYESCLVSSLNKPFHYPQLETLEDVVDSGKPIITKYGNLKSEFLDDFPLDRKLHEQIQVINSNRSTKEFVAFEDKISITRYYAMQLENYPYFDKDGNNLLHIVDECHMNYRIAYILRLNSPYTERVDFILSRLREAGLLIFWFDRIRYPLEIVKFKRKVEMEKKKIKLTLDHYSLTFLMLFGGLFCSILMLFYEIYAGKRE